MRDYGELCRADGCGLKGRPRPHGEVPRPPAKKQWPARYRAMHVEVQRPRRAHSCASLAIDAHFPLPFGRTTINPLSEVLLLVLSPVSSSSPAQDDFDRLSIVAVILARCSPRPRHHRKLANEPSPAPSCLASSLRPNYRPPALCLSLPSTRCHFCCRSNIAVEPRVGGQTAPCKHEAEPERSSLL